jgi:hypothetical protein
MSKPRSESSSTIPPRPPVHQTSKPFCFDTTGMFYWCPTQTVELQTIVKLI